MAAFFVQFPHPGDEHRPSGNHMPWNTEAHRRKFLVASGRYTDGDDEVRQAQLTLWAEWEPPSHVVSRWSPSERLPRTLHKPYWIRPTTRGFRQNTDPWIWGNQMLYSNCKQTVGGRPNAMQRLTRGSVICFGSTLDGQFCVDTVFVVASAEPWHPAAGTVDLDVDDAFTTCTAEALTSGEGRSDPCAQPLPFTLYRGASLDDPVDGMFSFVPAQLADDDAARFARPPFHLPGLVNPASTQSTWGARRPLDVADLVRAWTEVVEQVLTANLVLAVHLDTPECLETEDVPGTTRWRC